MNLQEALETRRSVRKYLTKPIDKALIDQMIEAAILAPSWKNSQVTRYYVIQTQDILEKVKRTLPEFNYQNVKDAPTLIVTTIVLNRSGFERDGNPTNELGNGWGYYDCGLHNMNLLLKATELGIATLVMGIRDEKEIKKLLGIDNHESVVSVIALGYPDMHPSQPQRKSVEDITKYY